MVRQHADDRRFVEPSVASVGRQQQLLLDSEVASALPLEEFDEGLASARRSFPLSPLELECGEQPPVMLVRQRPERLVALHAPDAGVESGATCRGGRREWTER